MNTKCPHCKSEATFEIVVEKVILLPSESAELHIVRCSLCKAALTALDRTVNAKTANVILTAIQSKSS